MKNLKNLPDWTLTETDVQKGHHENNFLMLEANMLAIKRDEKEFLSEFEDLRQQFRDILITAGINQSQLLVTPNRNVAIVDPLTPTFMNTPRGLSDLDVHKCLLINTLNDSALHDDGLGSDGSSDVEHSPMSTDTELSDYEEDTVFLEREVEGCGNNAAEKLEDSVQFSMSFVAGHTSKNTEKKKKSSGSFKGQGSNPLASSTMIEEKGVPVQRKHITVCRGASNPKASSTLLYKPFPERKVNKSFSPVVKIKDLQVIPTRIPEKKEVLLNEETNNANSIFTWSLQHTSNDVPLEESYLRSVKQLSTKPVHASKQMSTVNSRSHKIVSGSDIQLNRCTVQRQTEENTFKKPIGNSKDVQTTVERKNFVVKKLLRLRESFKRKNTTDLRTLANL